LTLGKAPRKKRQPKEPSLKEWLSRFFQLAHNDPESAKLLKLLHLSSFYGGRKETPPFMLPFLVYMYVSGAPHASAFRAACGKQIGDLAKQMQELARAIERFDSGQQGAAVRTLLQGLPNTKLAWAGTARIDEAYSRLPHLLSGLDV
jgi:hypothetical protein